MKITVLLSVPLLEGVLLVTFPPFTFLSVISFISVIFDHYYAPSQTATRTWSPFKRLLSPNTPAPLHLHQSQCLYYKKRNWLSKLTYLYLPKQLFCLRGSIAPTDEFDTRISVVFRQHGSASPGYTLDI